MMKKAVLVLAGAMALAISATSVNAAVYNVDAFANSSSSGTGLATLSLSAGEAYTVSVNPGDLWNAGPLPRWSNANGLTGDLFATGSDDSGQAAGTLIGQNFGLYTQANLTAPYGTLVGQIGSGDFFVIGTSYSGVASAPGTLNLYYWDSNNFDNTQYVTATVSAVPEPSTWALMLAGFAGLAFAVRRRTRRTASAI